MKPGDRILDFGCGTGGYVIPLAEAVAPNGEVIAVDKNPDNLQEVKSRLTKYNPPGHVSIRKTDGRLHLKWIKDGSLDTALVFDILHVIDDWYTLFTEMRRVLRRDGILLVNPASLSHKGEVDVARLMTTLRTCGFIFEYSLVAKAWHYRQPSVEEIFVFKAD